MIAVVTAIVLALVLVAVASCRNRRLAACLFWRSSGSIPASDVAIAIVNRVDHPTGRWQRSCPDWNCATASRPICAPSSSCRRCSPAHRRSKSRSSGWKFIIFPTRTTISLSRCSPTGGIARPSTTPDDESLLDRSSRRHCAAERALWAGGNRRALLPAASPARLERRRRKVDRLGAQARQAARTQPAAARRHRYDVPADRRPCAVAARRHPLCHHARCRYAPADRRRQAAGRQDGASAQPAAISIRMPAVVVHGHGILQPRVTPSLAHRQRRFAVPARLFRPQRPRSLCLRGFRRLSGSVRRRLLLRQGHLRRRHLRGALEGQIPENTVLSHDLLEGIFARAGLASDIEVVEEFPSRYDVAAARQHRWVRGDWQLLPWIFGFRGAGRATARAKTPLPLMGRWKLLDNLRRSLSAPAALLALLIGWLLPMPAAEIWTAFILVTIALPPLLPAIAGIVPRRAGVSLRNHLRALRGDFALGLLQSAFLITFLAHQAWVMVDAVVRTLFRAVHPPASSARMGDRRADRRRARSSTRAASSLQIAASAGVRRRCRRRALCLRVMRTWPIAAPFVVLVGVVAARRALGEPAAARGRSFVDHAERTPWRCGWSRGAPGASSKNSSRRKTTCCRPTIFRKIPKPVVAHRTSPTNIGLYLLSIVAARDFGWLGTLDTLERLEATFATMAKLERFRGHFYNWYDTSDLRALEPKYVSSVDSGNLAGHLIVLGNACREIAAGPIGNPHWIAGLSDTLALLRERRASADRGAPRECRAASWTQHRCFAPAFDTRRQRRRTLRRRLADLTQKADAIVASHRPGRANAAARRSGNHRLGGRLARIGTRPSAGFRCADAVGEPASARRCWSATKPPHCWTRCPRWPRCRSTAKRCCGCSRTGALRSCRTSRP